MTNVHGDLLRDGAVIATGLEICLGTLRPPTGREEWHGSFRLPPGTRLERGEYSLRLADGRTGDIIVTFTSVFCDRSLAAQFVGAETRGG